MPLDDWLCQKLECLNLTVAKGYPSRAQDSAGLKRDQFIKVSKSQSRWYKMHLMKPERPHRPGRSVFSWYNSEAKVNSQFPRITRLNKGKAPKEVYSALSDLRDFMAFHRQVSVAIGMALQPLADSLFVHLSNLVLLRRDAYLDYVKTGVKQDTINLLRNAPLFGYGLFPDAAIVTAEQDIHKHESSSVTQGPGLVIPQHTSWRGADRYRPYERRDQKSSSSADQSFHQQQPWRQFSRSRSRGCGCGRGANPRFSKSHQYKPYK